MLNYGVLRFGSLHEMIDVKQIRCFGRCKEGFEQSIKRLP